MTTSVAFIGLGVMGYPMAGHLQKAGYDVCVFNRTFAKAEKWQQEYSGRVAETPVEAANGAEVVFVCVGNDDDVRSVVYGDTGVLAGMEKNSILVDHTTASAELAREVSEAAAKQGVAFLDAPVSGGQAGADNGQLTVMVGGESSDLLQISAMLETYSRHVGLQGPVGLGSWLKW